MTGAGSSGRAKMEGGGGGQQAGLCAGLQHGSQRNAARPARQAGSRSLVLIPVLPSLVFLLWVPSQCPHVMPMPVTSP